MSNCLCDCACSCDDFFTSIYFSIRNQSCSTAWCSNPSAISTARSSGLSGTYPERRVSLSTTNKGFRDDPCTKTT